jgi:HPr kinase/phosphorylase
LNLSTHLIRSAHSKFTEGTDDFPMLINATCILLEDKGVLLAGPAGSGKSDLALRLVDAGAELVADDQTELRLAGGTLIAAAPATIQGLFEVRHIGLVRMPHATSARIALYVDLVPLQEELARLPEANTILLLDRPVRRLRLPGFAASTPAKVRAALLYPIVTDSE